MSYVEKINLNVSADISISVIFLIYSLFLLVMAIWGSIILPKYCNSDKLKTYFRFMVLLSSCSLIFIIGFMKCKLACREIEIVAGKSGTFSVQESKYNLPPFLLGFWIIFTVFSLTIQSLIQDELGYLTPDQNCNTENFFYYKEVNAIGIGISVFSLVIFLTMIGFKISDNIKKRKEDTPENELLDEINLTNSNKGMEFLSVPQLDL